MDKNWLAFLISGVVVILVITVTAGFYKTANTLSGIANAPASTTNITIDSFTMLTESGISIEIAGFHAEGSSRLIDMIYLAVASQ